MFQHDRSPWNKPWNEPTPGAGHLPITQGDHPHRGSALASSRNPGREQFRLFCLLENAAAEELARRGQHRPAIAVITGMRKPWHTFSADDQLIPQGVDHVIPHPGPVSMV